MADGVVAQLEGMKIPQHCQTSFIQTGQVVVGQISEDGEKKNFKLKKQLQRENKTETEKRSV